MHCVGLLLAAGGSTRFGSDKRLHPLPGGIPMAVASARHLAAVCMRTIVVIRPEDAALGERLRTERIETVICQDAASGMGHSLRRGVAVTADADAWLVALADMPFIAADSYRVVLAALQDGAGLARPCYQNQPGHPVGFSASFLPDLLALHGDQGGKAILNTHPGVVRHCPVSDPGVLRDIDRGGDLDGV